MTQRGSPLRAYLVDDEPLALKRLSRLLDRTGRVQIAGSTTSPEEAIQFLAGNTVDALFLDIQMPGMTGFELLGRLRSQPLVIFTTAFDQYALDAFEVNSVDYLLKPVEEQHLDRALTKLERLCRGVERVTETERLRAIARELAQGLSGSAQASPKRLASRVGERVVFVDVASITHFYAKDKLTFASTSVKDYVIDNTIAELEQKLDPAQFVRIHRSTLLNLNYVEETNSWFGGGMVVRLKDAKRTELQVARDRVRELRSRLDF
jgi:two-component system, LytTR family, response regulator